MLEIASIKTKKISDLQKIAEEIGLKNFKDLKKTDLIYQIIDQAASKKDSTCAALLVPKPMSIRDAPREKAPFGMSISPAAIPDKTLCIVPTLLSLKLVLKLLTLTLIGVVLISTMTKHSEFARTLLLFLDYQRFLIHCFY